MNSKHPFLILISFTGIVGMLVAGVFAALVYGFVHQDLIAYGVRYAGIPVTGLTLSEAEDAIQKDIDEKLNGPAVIFTLPSEAAQEGKKFSISPSDMGIVPDAAATAKEAFEIGRESNALMRVATIISCVTEGRDVPLAVTLDEDRMRKALERVAAEVRVEPRNARVSVGGNGPKVHEGAAGRMLDVEPLMEELKPKMAALDIPQRVELKLTAIEPEIKTEDVAATDALLASYTTYYNPSSSRGDNIAIAAAAINGTFVKSGEEFSFNSVVGWRVPEAGYQMAPVIVDGKHEMDFGGGVCQVSSTLYNAVLLADLTVTARASHFYPSGYVPAGLDATVADGVLDFCFKNDLPHGVTLISYADGGDLTVEVWGHGADLPYEVALETEVLDERPTVAAYRVYYDDGGYETGREKLHTDLYDVPSEHGEDNEQQAR